MQAVLEVNDKVYTLLVGSVYLIGSSTTEAATFIGITGKNSSVDAKHAVLEVGTDSVRLYDLCTSAGTFVKGTRLEALKLMRLYETSHLKFGDVNCQLRFNPNEESLDSSGFHDGAKNTSIQGVCQSPEKSYNPLAQRILLNRSDDESALRLNHSFLVPETQRMSLNKSTCSNSFGMDHEDSFIPETQQLLPPPADNARTDQVRLRTGADSAADAAAVSDGESEFRVDTQTYNDGFAALDDSDVVCSMIIPHLIHDPLPVVEPSEDEQANASKTNAQDDDAEMAAVDWNVNKLTTKEAEIDDDRLMDTCTPDLFDLPSLAMKNMALVITPEIVEPAAATSGVPPNPDIVDDLLPTQLFNSGEYRAEKVKSANDFLTLSDKENMLPHKALAMEATQVFANNPPATSFNFPPPTVTPPLPVPAEAPQPVESVVTPNDLDKDDAASLASTQIFPMKQALQAVAVKRSLNSTPLQAGDKSTPTNAATFFAELSTNGAAQSFKTPKSANLRRAASPATSIVSASESDFSAMKNTPMFIKQLFDGSPNGGGSQRLSSAKQKELFGDDSDGGKEDEDDDLFQKLVKKVPRDFDALLPHLKESEQPSTNNGHFKEEKVSKEKTSPREGRGTHDKDKDKTPTTHRDDKKAREEKKETKGRSKSNLSIGNKKRHHDSHASAKGAEDQPKGEQRAKTVVEKSTDKPKDSTHSRQRVTRTQSHSVGSADDLPQSHKARSSAHRSKDALLAEPKKEPITPIMRTTRAKSRDEDIKSKGKVVQFKSEAATLSRRASVSARSSMEEKNANKARPSKKEAKPTAQTSRGRTPKSSEDSLPGQDQEVIFTTQPTERKRVTRSRSKQESQESQESCSSLTSLVDKSKATRGNGAANERKRKTTTAATTSNGTTANEEHHRKRLRSSNSRSELSLNTASGSAGSNSTIHLKICTTMVEPERLGKLQTAVSEFCTVTNDPLSCDVLIMDKGNRTYKFLVAVARGIPIVSSAWLDSIRKQRLIPHFGEYFFVDAHFQKRHRFNLLKSLELARKHRLFAGQQFLLTPHIVPQPNELSVIIECAGGLVLKDMPSQCPARQRLYVVTAPSDKLSWHQYRRLGEGVRLISSEGVMASVMRQDVKPLDTNLLA